MNHEWALKTESEKKEGTIEEMLRNIKEMGKKSKEVVADAKNKLDLAKKKTEKIKDSKKQDPGEGDFRNFY